MSRSNQTYTPPDVITSNMVPVVVAPLSVLFTNFARTLITRGTIVAIDPGTGLLIPQDNTGGYPLVPVPAIGVAANNANPGEVCYVQTSGTMLVVPVDNLVEGNLIGNSDGTGGISDLGSTVSQVIGLSGAFSTIGIALQSVTSGTACLVLIQPQYYGKITGASSDIGKNMVALPLQLTTDTGDSNFSFNLRIPGSSIVGVGSHFTLTLNAGAGGTTTLVAAVIRRTLRGSIAWLDSTPITWSGSATPTFAASTSNVSDSIAVTIDTAHDYYIIVATGSALGVTEPAISNAALNGNGGEQPGNQTATADTTTLNFTGPMPCIAQVSIA